MTLVRQGIPVVLIDRARHPRFAIGESTTPLADAALTRLANRYQLASLLPLTQYGAWKDTYPDLMCGRKRGFTYLDQTRHQPLTAADFSSRRLLAQASDSNVVSDTQWLRSDVDQFFFQEAQRLGVQCVEGIDVELEHRNPGWIVRGSIQGEPFLFHAGFLVDATGSGGGLLRSLKIPYQTETLLTNSRSIFAHFEGVASCTEVLTEIGIDCGQFPFCCDDAAVHQVFADGWMWQLRFDDDTLSAGFVIDQRHRSQQRTSLSSQAEWDQRVAQNPFLRRQFRDARVIRVPQLITADRIQRLTTQAAGEDWAVLANTAGFIDALHSTGIAHTLLTVERLAAIIPAQHGIPQRAAELRRYSDLLIAEIRHVDRLVEGCYASLPAFDLWCDWVMLYFAAVTSMEEQEYAAHPESASDDLRHDCLSGCGFLRANDAQFCAFVSDARRRLSNLVPGPSTAERTSSPHDAAFRDWLREVIEPWNKVGLFDPAQNGLYHSTSAPKKPLYETHIRM